MLSSFLPLPSFLGAGRLVSPGDAVANCSGAADIVGIREGHIPGPFWRWNFGLTLKCDRNPLNYCIRSLRSGQFTNNVKHWPGSICESKVEPSMKLMLILAISWTGHDDDDADDYGNGGGDGDADDDDGEKQDKKGIPGKKQKEKHFLSKSQLSAPRQKHEWYLHGRVAIIKFHACIALKRFLGFLIFGQCASVLDLVTSDVSQDTSQQMNVRTTCTFHSPGHNWITGHTLSDQHVGKRLEWIRSAWRCMLRLLNVLREHSTPICRPSPKSPYFVFLCSSHKLQRSAGRSETAWFVPALMAVVENLTTVRQRCNKLSLRFLGIWSHQKLIGPGLSI